MAIVTARASYFETGLEILADLGLGKLKLAEVCGRLGVTTGSFYHYFTSWNVYTRELVAYWREDRTLKLADVIRQEPDARKRIRALIEAALSLPHGAEAAIRAWSSVDAEVHAVQVEVDRERFNLCYEYALEIVGDTRQAEVFADWAVYLLVGYEQSTLRRDPLVYEWISNQMLDHLESGRFVTVPPP